MSIARSVPVQSSVFGMRVALDVSGAFGVVMKGVTWRSSLK